MKRNPTFFTAHPASVRQSCATALVLLALSAAATTVAPAVRDAQRTAALRDVRLEGYPSLKMNALFRERCTSDFAKTEIFGEARREFRDRDDDVLVPVAGRLTPCGGLWRGEFWGKQMLSAARVADYLNDPSYVKWIGDECHRMMDLQDPSGYLGSYGDPDLVAARHAEEFKKAYGWIPCWNLWNRKYAMWGMLMAYKVTGDRAILDSVCRQMDFEIAQLDRLGLRIEETGMFSGLPSMSVLKPLLMLYAETGRKAYIDFATRIVDTWKRPDAPPPAFFANARNGKPLHAWYPEPPSWAKSYEMMSCLDGLLEYYRMTGDRACLDVVRDVRDNINATEINPLGGVGFGDKFIGATMHVNGLNEICDVIHWIRLNLDLFLITGEDRYMDAVEVAYFNAYLAGIFRKGDWGPFFIRACGRHECQYQVGEAYGQCCVNNLPRTFMDIASSVVTADAKGGYRVNLCQDATVTLDGVKFEIRGNYPVDNRVTVRTSKPVPVTFRKPSWCPNLSVETSSDSQTHTLTFDMNPRLDERPEGDPAVNAKSEKLWAYRRYRDYWSVQVNQDVQRSYRTTAAARVLWGPLILTKSFRTGLKRAEAMKPDTVNGKGYAVRVTPVKVADSPVWGQWDVRLEKAGAEPIVVRACDFGSGTDLPTRCTGEFFSIWF